MRIPKKTLDFLMFFNANDLVVKLNSLERERERDSSSV